MAIALAPRMCILVGKTVGEIRNHHNVRGAIRDLCAMPYGNTGVEGLSGVGVPDTADKNTGRTVHFELQINND